MYLIDGSHEDYVVAEGSAKVLYLVLNKALCGAAKKVLLCHDLLTDTLVECAFKLNPRDQCAANAMVKGNQCTIMWHVDDAKTSHMDSSVVDDVTKMLEFKFGKIKVARGRCHELLGQVITHNDNRTFDLKMSSYLKEAVEKFGEPMGPTVTPDRFDLL